MWSIRINLSITSKRPCSINLPAALGLLLALYRLSDYTTFLAFLAPNLLAAPAGRPFVNPNRNEITGNHFCIESVSDYTTFLAFLAPNLLAAPAGRPFVNPNRNEITGNHFCIESVIRLHNFLGFLGPQPSGSPSGATFC
jgi:hypothetical protein